MQDQSRIHTQTPPKDVSVGTLLRELSDESTTLVRKEVELAKAEISQKVSQVGTGLTSLAIGGFIAFAGFLVLLDAAVVALAEAFPASQDWLAPLIVGAVVAIIGWMVLAKGRSNLKTANLTPHRTAESLRRDKEFAKEQLK